jgi:hypothetical protein
MIFLLSKESTSIIIICENYTPNGVVVVVDVEPKKVATKEMVVKIEVFIFLWNIIHFKCSIF